MRTFLGPIVTFKNDDGKYYSAKGEREVFIQKWKDLEVLCDSIFHPITGTPMDELFTRYMYYERAKQGIKPAHRAGKVQLIDASHCFEPRRKSIGTKRNDITDACRELIVTAYGEFAKWYNTTINPHPQAIQIERC